MKSLMQQFTSRLRERLMRRWGVTWSRHGTPASLVRTLPRRALTLIDIGAHNGDFAASLRSEYGLEKALLVEPQPALARRLRERFPDRNIVVAETAVSDSQGETTMELLAYDYAVSLLPVDRSRSSVLEKLDLDVKDKVNVPVTTLDHLCAQHGIERADVLKVDVQGAEMMVFRGAPKILGATRFVLSEVAFRPYYIGGATFEEITSHLREHGFRLLSLTENFNDARGELLEADALYGRV